MQNCHVMYFAVKYHQFLVSVVLVALPWRNPAAVSAFASVHLFVADC